MSAKPSNKRQRAKPEQKKVKPTKEQLEALRDQKQKFYEEQLPALRVEAEYHQLTSQIHEGIYRTQLAKLKYAELMADQNDQPSKT